MFVSRLNDGIQFVHRTGMPFMTSFLTPAQQNLALQMVRGVDLHFDGGFEQAERKIAILSLSDYKEADLVMLRALQSAKAAALHHPDLLGALLHEGISRESLGDLICTDQAVYVICKPAIADYLQQAPLRVGRQILHFETCVKQDLPEVHMEEIRINVSSLRYDSIVAALAHCSRSKAEEMIRQGYVKINDVVLENRGKLCNNDHVSIRRCGRFQFLETEKTTRKDRLVLRFKKYS